MADTTDATTACHWLAIDVGRYSNAVLIETAAGQRHRFNMRALSEYCDLYRRLAIPGKTIGALEHDGSGF